MQFTIRLTKNQYQTVKLKSQLSGYHSLGAFVRSKLLKENPSKRKIQEIYEQVIKHGTQSENNSNHKRATESNYQEQSRSYGLQE